MSLSGISIPRRHFVIDIRGDIEGTNNLVNNVCCNRDSTRFLKKLWLFETEE